MEKCLGASSPFQISQSLKLAGEYDLQLVSEWKPEKGRRVHGPMKLWAPDTLIQNYEPNWYAGRLEARGGFILSDTVQSWSKGSTWRPLIGSAEIDIDSVSIPAAPRLFSRDPFEPGLRLVGNELEIVPEKLGFYRVDGWSTTLTIERVNARGFAGKWETVGLSQVRNGNSVGNPRGSYCALRTPMPSNER